MDDPNRTRLAILQLLQSGALAELVGCRAQRCAKVEVRVERIYHVVLNRRTVVMQEHEVERIRQKTGRRWKQFGPTVSDRGRTVLDRTSGQILQSPQLGVLRPAGRVPRRQGAASPRQTRPTLVHATI